MCHFLEKPKTTEAEWDGGKEFPPQAASVSDLTRCRCCYLVQVSVRDFVEVCAQVCVCTQGVRLFILQEGVCVCLVSDWKAGGAEIVVGVFQNDFKRENQQSISFSWCGISPESLDLITGKCFTNRVLWFLCVTFSTTFLGWRANLRRI